MQDLFTNMFPLDGKIKLSVAGVSENGRKKWFPLARKKPPSKRILFQVDRKLVSNDRKWEFV